MSLSKEAMMGKVIELNTEYGTYCGHLAVSGKDQQVKEFHPTTFIDYLDTMYTLPLYEVTFGFLIQFIESDDVVEFMSDFIWETDEESIRALENGQVKDIEGLLKYLDR